MFVVFSCLIEIRESIRKGMTHIENVIEYLVVTFHAPE